MFFTVAIDEIMAAGEIRPDGDNSPVESWSITDLAVPEIKTNHDLMNSMSSNSSSVVSMTQLENPSSSNSEKTSSISWSRQSPTR